MRFRTLIAALVVSALVVGCAEQSTITESLPQFNFTNAPDASGIVVRDEFPVAFTWVDTKAGTRVTIGVDVFEFCAGIINFDFVPYQDVLLPEDRPLLTLGLGDDMRTTVWPFLDFDCDLFTTVTPLAHGVSDLVHTDNDLFGAQPDDNNANAWGFMAHGILASPSGADAPFHAHIRLRFGNSAGFKVLSAKIVLN